MGNTLNSCCINHMPAYSELTMETEETNLDHEYLRKTTSDEVLKMLLSRNVRESIRSKSYSTGAVKVSIF